MLPSLRPLISHKGLNILNGPWQLWKEAGTNTHSRPQAYVYVKFTPSLSIKIPEIFSLAIPYVKEQVLRFIVILGKRINK